jgi:hypothetical protein
VAPQRPFRGGVKRLRQVHGEASRCAADGDSAALLGLPSGLTRAVVPPAPPTPTAPPAAPPTRAAAPGRFDPAGILHFDDVAELPRLVAGLSAARYTALLPAVRRNFAAARRLTDPLAWMWAHGLRDAVAARGAGAEAGAGGAGDGGAGSEELAEAEEARTAGGMGGAAEGGWLQGGGPGAVEEVAVVVPVLPGAAARWGRRTLESLRAQADAVPPAPRRGLRGEVGGACVRPRRGCVARGSNARAAAPRQGGAGGWRCILACRAAEEAEVRAAVARSNGSNDTATFEVRRRGPGAPRRAR